MNIEINDVRTELVSNMSQDDLELAECHLQSQVDHISHQLKFNKGSDEQWIESANYALIMFNKQLRYVKLYLKRIQRDYTVGIINDLKENLKHG